LIVAMCWLVAGCARQTQPLSLAPTSEELPEIKEVQRTIPATVVAEKPADESRVRLVPSFKEPELTAEEQAALGKQPLDFKFLLYQLRSQPPGSPVGTWLGGVQTFSYGYGKPSILYSPRPIVSGVFGPGSVAVEVDTAGSRVTGLIPPSQGPVGVGPASGIAVETDPRDSRIARRKPHFER
jgi:hypothetical protein